MKRLHDKNAWILKNLAPIFLLSFLLMYPSFAGAAENLSKSSSSSEWPAVEVNSDGDVMVVWTEWDSGDIFYQIFKNGQWSGMRNAGIARKRAWSNQLALDSAEKFHVNYADGVSSAAREIYYSHFTGSSWATAEAVYISPYNSAWNRMAIDSNDKIYVAWYHSHVPKDAGTPSSDIAVNSKQKGGNWPGNIENASKSNKVVSIHPALAVRNGNVYTAWMEDENPRWLYFNEKVGGSWKSPVALEKGGYYPDMIVDGSGNLNIVYSNRSGNFYLKSRVNGQWNSKKVLSNGGAPLQFGDINYSHNTIVAGWSQGQDGVYAVYVSHKKSGTAWSTPVKVSPNDSVSNKHVSVALDKDGYVHAVWEGAGVGGEKDIFYSKTRLGEPAEEGDNIVVDKSFIQFITKPGMNPPPQSFQVKASGENALSYTISSNRSWLTVYPLDGEATQSWDTIEVSVDVDDFSNGTYNGKITITAPDAENTPVEISVTVEVGTQEASYIQVSKSLLHFSSYVGMNNPPSQTFNVSNAGTGNLDFEVIPSHAWIRVAPDRASSGGEVVPITVSVDSSSKGTGTHTGHIKIKDPKAKNSPQYVDVELSIKNSPRPYPPVNVKVEKIDHVGLMIREYKNKVTWKNNPANSGRFAVKKYKIFRKDKSRYYTSYAYIAEVGGNVLRFYDGGFSSEQERDKYAYSVVCVDSNGKESQKAEMGEMININPRGELENRFVERKADRKKEYK
jgi:hypothetical protein